MEYLIFDGDITYFVESQRRNVCEEIVEQLTEKRLERNMTQQDIANITGIQRPNVARLEACSTTPSIDVLMKYAAALGYKINISLEEIEDQRKGRNKATSVDMSYINSGEYRRKFDKITYSSKLNRLLYEKAKEMLKHRSGTEHEDMYWFDLDNECVLCHKLDETNLKEIRHTKAITKKLERCNRVLAMHTHPHSMPPSAEDFNCFVQAGYDRGVILCHDGTVYIYSAEKEVSKELMEFYINANYKEYNDEKIAQIMALDKFEKIGLVKYREVSEE